MLAQPLQRGAKTLCPRRRLAGLQRGIEFGDPGGAGTDGAAMIIRYRRQRADIGMTREVFRGRAAGLHG